MKAHRNNRFLAAKLACLTVFISAAVQAEPVTYKRTITNANAVQAGVSGVGGGSGDITIAGVSGSVTHAYLYWHGINNSGAGAVYDNATISINGNSITGISQGDASTNCWGAGSSRAFEADVAQFVRGNGTYALSGLSNGQGHNANGASLIVVYNDGIASNNRDYVFFTGNDSNNADGAFPNDANGWAASLDSINYRGGTVRATLHASDGQSFADGVLGFSTPNGSLTIADTAELWDSTSVPNAGTSRAGADGLYDVHSFDVSSAFGGVQGSTSLSMSSNVGGDCLALNTMVLDLEAGSSPSAFSSCAAEGYKGSKLTLCRQVCEIEQSPSRLNSLIKLYMAIYRTEPPCAR